MFSKPFFLLLLTCIIFPADSLQAQSRKRDPSKAATMRGKIAYDRNMIQSWDGKKLVIPYRDIEAKIREKITLPRPPYPKGIKKWTGQQIMQWEQKFVQTAAGKRFLEKQNAMIEQANVFDIKFAKDGSFVIYDVPSGTYGIQGRTDRDIEGTLYAFEVFGEVTVLKDMQEIILDPIRIEVTPLIQSGQKAPPLSVKTFDGKDKLSLNMDYFENQLTFVNFWSSLSPSSAQEQKLVQDMFKALGKKHNLRLLSVNIDQDRKKVLKYLVDNELRGGRHGFTSTVNHRAIFDYGVRSFPSFWLIGKDGNIRMSQFEIGSLMRTKPDLTTIVSDHLEGKVPTPAEKEPNKRDN
ncbi:MAG: thioredoxin family protein [Planctomycetota bacterium]